MTEVIVSGTFDNLRTRQVRFLEEAARLGPVHALLWSDQQTLTFTGDKPKFPLPERQYFLESIRYVENVTISEDLDGLDTLPPSLVTPSRIWAVMPEQDNLEKRGFCIANGLEYRVIFEESLGGFALPTAPPNPSERMKVLVTGCYDWLHTGHVRFFEEVSQLGALYVVIGSDANVRLLKGEGHPLFSQEERRYMVHAIRFVTAVAVSTGTGWMDAEPEIAQILPDIYAVNEDGDKPEKRAFCQEHHLEYTVLKRLPKEGLPRRESTLLRGF
jgi:cytidyltransferase-like protein